MKPTPTINVNLTSHCYDCGSSPPGPHATECAALEVKLRPVLIPCPVPRSVTFEVRLGGCDCFPSGHRSVPVPPMRAHSPQCASQPVRVSCSISGKTWEESEVTECEANIPGDGYPANLMGPCRERWASVKALVLGARASDYTGWCGSSLRAFAGLFTQRDAVYAALADMARAEEAIRVSHAAIDKAMGLPWSESEPLSQRALERYVERLIEQVGVL